MTGGRLPRTLRLDPSDTFVFERAAEPGEWAVTGAFLFWDTDVAALTGRARAAFRSGFAGVDSLGHSTLVTVAPASAAERASAVRTLARHVRERLGAPDEASALAAAEEEIAFAETLCGPEIGSVIALHRTLSADGEIQEAFRTLRQRAPGAAGADRLHAHARVFHFVETDEDEAEEQADLIGLMEKSGRTDRA